MKRLLVVALLSVATAAMADQVTFTCVNFSHSTFLATASELQFANCVNVLVTDNSTGKNEMLLAVDSGNTGVSTDFKPGPPLEADYLGSGAGSALIAASGHTFLSGTMADGGRLEANYPNAAGAFLSRFHVDFVDPAVLEAIGSPTHWAPDGSVSLTLAETSFDGATLNATLGGGEYTITTLAAPVPEAGTMLLFGLGITCTAFVGRRNWQ